MNKTNIKTGVRNDDGGILEAILGETKPTPEASLQLADPSQAHPRGQLTACRPFSAELLHSESQPNCLDYG